MIAEDLIFPNFIGESTTLTYSPIFNTNIFKSVSGAEVRVSNYVNPLYEIKLQFEYLSIADLQTFANFFTLVGGQAKTFLLRAPMNFLKNNFSFTKTDSAKFWKWWGWKFRFFCFGSLWG